MSYRSKSRSKSRSRYESPQGSVYSPRDTNYLYPGEYDSFNPISEARLMELQSDLLALQDYILTWSGKIKQYGTVGNPGWIVLYNFLEEHFYPSELFAFFLYAIAFRTKDISKLKNYLFEFVVKSKNEKQDLGGKNFGFTYGFKYLALQNHLYEKLFDLDYKNARQMIQDDKKILSVMQSFSYFHPTYVQMFQMVMALFGLPPSNVSNPQKYENEFLIPTDVIIQMSKYFATRKDYWRESTTLDYWLQM